MLRPSVQTLLPLSVVAILIVFSTLVLSQSTNSPVPRPRARSNGDQATAQRDAQEQDQSNILGAVPVERQNRITRQRVWIKVGGQDRLTDDLVEAALDYLLAREKISDISKLRADVFIPGPGHEDSLAEIFIFQGIGKPCWRITLDSKLQVRKFVRSVAVG